MELDPTVQRDGMRWLVGAGAVAILFSCFLYSSDIKLSTSDSELRLEQSLIELRTAQSSLDSGPQDPRAGVKLELRKPVVTTKENTHSGGHH